MKTDNESMSLSKFIATAGICSRRKAVEEIKLGYVKVNATVVTDPAFKLKETDKITYKDKKIKIDSKIYLVLNKPEGFVTTVSDELQRQTVIDILSTSKKLKGIRLYPVGRLDMNTTGLLLLTNDGELAQKLSHPSFEISKTYKVVLDQDLSKEGFEKIQHGLRLEDGFIKVDNIYFAKRPGRKKVIVDIHSGKNRIVRRIFKAVGCNVTSLERTAYAGITKQALPTGDWRFLTKKEIQGIKALVYPKTDKPEQD